MVANKDHFFSEDCIFMETPVQITDCFNPLSYVSALQSSETKDQTTTTGLNMSTFLCSMDVSSSLVQMHEMHCLFTEQQRFPNTKLFEAGEEEQVDSKVPATVRDIQGNVLKLYLFFHANKTP